MIHRDIKPSNILLDRRSPAQNGRNIGEPILSDFGIARLLGMSTIHHSGWMLGTPYYTSPEQAIGGPGNELSDIYALSVVLYEACTGMLPFQGGNPAAVTMQHVYVSPRAPVLLNPQLPAALSDVILCGLAKDPADRFPSASRLGMALAEALNVPVPEGLRQRAYQGSEGSKLASISSARLQTFPAQSSPTVEPAQPQLLVSPPLLAQSLPSTTTPPTLPAPSFPQQRRGGKLIRTLLIALVLFGACVGALLLLTQRNTPPAAVNPIVGHAFFVNSGQLNPDNSQGINDEVLLELQNIADPPPGKAYYAWLLGDKAQSELAMTSLGRLTVNHGSVYLLYPGNAQHTNLLAYESRILITAEDASVPPTTFAPDYKAWKYYAELSQAPSPKDQLHFSMLDHLRHLLSESPELKLRGLHGGLDMWFLRNTEKTLEWANAARDDWGNSPDLLHRQIVRILDYLDGASYVQQDAPAVGPTLLVDPHDAQVALLGPAPNNADPPGYTFQDEVPPGYVYLLPSHLAGTVLSPDATADQRALANQIHIAFDQVKNWLEKVHQDAKQLIVMNANQLAQPTALALLNDLVTQTQFAYTGQIDPLTGQVQGGALWICSNIQRLATFDIKPYTG